MKEKILYYLVLPFAFVFFCIFGIVGNVYATETVVPVTAQKDFDVVLEKYKLNEKRFYIENIPTHPSGNGTLPSMYQDFSIINYENLQEFGYRYFFKYNDNYYFVKVNSGTFKFFFQKRSDGYYFGFYPLESTSTSLSFFKLSPSTSGYNCWSYNYSNKSSTVPSFLFDKNIVVENLNDLITNVDIYDYNDMNSVLLSRNDFFDNSSTPLPTPDFPNDPIEVGKIINRKINPFRISYPYLDENDGIWSGVETIFNSNNDRYYYENYSSYFQRFGTNQSSSYRDFFYTSIDNIFPSLVSPNYSVNLKFRYEINSANIDETKIKPFISKKFIDIHNDKIDYVDLSIIKDFDEMEHSYQSFNTKDSTYYFVSPICEIDEYNKKHCTVEYTFPQGYISKGDVVFGFYNKDKTYRDTDLQNVWLSEDVEWTYGEPIIPPQEDEQLETSKGIFGTLKNVLTSILDLPGKIATAILDGLKTVLEPLFNIVSDLIEGLTKLIKDLFIPSDDYFQDFFDKLLDFIQKKLGFLSYPFTWLIDIMQYYLNLSDTKNYVLNWNDIMVPNFNHVIIHAGTFNLSTALADSNVKMAYDIYLAFVDTIIFLAFLKLCKNKYASIVGGEKDDFEYVSVSDGYNIDSSTGEVISQRHTIRRTTRERKSG